MWFSQSVARVSKNYWRPVAASLLAVKYTVFLKKYSSIHSPTWPWLCQSVIKIRNIWNRPSRKMYFSFKIDNSRQSYSRFDFETKSDESEYHAAVAEGCLHYLWKSYLANNFRRPIRWIVTRVWRCRAVPIKIFAAAGLEVNLAKCKIGAGPD